jgi:hypothetical protein
MFENYSDTFSSKNFGMIQPFFIELIFSPPRYITLNRQGFHSSRTTCIWYWILFSLPFPKQGKGGSGMSGTG